MDRKVAIVSAGNEQYFHLIDGLIASIEDAGLPDWFGLCVYDVGFTGGQVGNLRSRGVTVVAPPWNFEFPNQGRAPQWLRAMTNRPCLPEYFPGFESYLWIDADAWVQRPDGIFAAVEAAKEGAIAIVAERFGKGLVFPVQNPSGGYKDVMVDEKSVRRNLASCYRNCFGEDKEHLAQQAFYNTGFFALREDSPIWGQWLRRIQEGLNRASHKLVEQQALTMGILEGEIAAAVLPNIYNWNLACMEPIYDTKTGQVVDPEERKAIGLVHLTDVKHLHFVDVPDLDGRMVRLRLRYRDFHAHRMDGDQA